MAMYFLGSSGMFHFFAYDEFIMRTEIWMSSIRNSVLFLCQERQARHLSYSISLRGEELGSITPPSFSSTK